MGSSEEIRAIVEARAVSNQQKLEVLTALLGECETLGDRKVIDSPNRPWAISFPKVGLKIAPTLVPSDGWWVYQVWTHPARRRTSYVPDIVYTKFIQGGEPSALRSLVLHRASIVEELLSRTPIRWHHFVPPEYIVVAIAFSLFVVYAGVVLIS